MPAQSTSHLLMIRPVAFGFNPETAVNNAFQEADQDRYVQEKALAEFDHFVNTLQQHGIDITVINDTPQPHTPDSIFPNNWVSFHDDGSIILYPMFAPNRRMERKQHILDEIGKKFHTVNLIDLSDRENENRYLEGTGSLVLDREYKIAFACLSARTDTTLLQEFCEITGFRGIPFDAVDARGKEIYHTNVMMCVADRYAIVCLEAIPDEKDRTAVQEALTSTHKEIIPISLGQMDHFAGNMLQVENKEGNTFLVMSTQAFQALHADQQDRLSALDRIIHCPLDTIERNGGGSARCMLAEIFLPVRETI